MNSLMNTKDRGGLSHPHPIPSLSFSLSTPPDLSPDDEFIPRGATQKSTTSPADIQVEEVSDGVSSTQIDSARVKIDSSHSPTNGGLALVAPPGMGRSLVDMTAKERGMDDPELVNVANQFISEVISKAKEEASHKCDNGPNEKSTLLSSGSGSRDHRRGPWYARAVRFLSGIFGKMCPCRTPGEP